MASETIAPNDGLANSNEFIISSSWSLESEEKKLENTVTLDSSNKRIELEDVVQLDTCVHLIRNEDVKNEKEPCTIIITIPDSSTKLLSQLVVVSEARIIELFGRCGEYLTTGTAEYVDDFEDCAVYMAECTVKPTRQLLIKFQKTKHADSLWLYGICLRLSQCKRAQPPFSSINFQCVNEMLKEAKIPLSENAEKCKTFLQAYSGTFDQSQLFKNKPPTTQMLMKMLEAGYINPLSGTGRSMSRCINNFVPFLTKDNDESKSNHDSCIGQNDSERGSDVLILKHYIDQRFRDLENKIEKLEQSIKDSEIRQNEKLDCIIALLNKSNC